MQRQIIIFAVTRDKGNITRIVRTGIFQPGTNFKGGSIKWHEDEPKRECK